MNLPPATPTDPDRRPSPEALLRDAQRAGRGRLKIFLGAAPGVGKTYEMLQSARRRREAGVDVVAGIVETHGRVETQALLAGLEILPRRRERYQNAELEELDLDALLQRRPQLALIDELAHSNAPGSRHPKRWQDVLELLDAGIDVYSTLNIQHLESLNDVVASITHVRVRETVPDSVLEAAEEIEVVDITPADLMQRLREGKVYRGEAGERALQHYFTGANLTALRELALRRTAESVEDQLQQQRRVRGVAQVWAAAERVLVCVDDSGSGPDLVRYTKRLADKLDAPWTALHLETARSLRLSEHQREQVLATLRLAEQLGADTQTLPGGADLVDTLLHLVREHNITQLILGRRPRSRLHELLHGSLARELLRRAQGFTVQVLAVDPAGSERSMRRVTPAPVWYWGRGADHLRALLYAAIATAVGLLLDRYLSLPNVSLVFLPAVMLAAMRGGLMPGLACALLSALAYNFLFLPPLYTFTIGDPANVLALIAFLATAVFTSRLTARGREQAQLASDQAMLNGELLQFSRQIAGLRRLDELMQVAARRIAQMLDAEAVVLAAEPDGLKIRGASSPQAVLEEADLAAANWCRDKAQPTGHGSDTLPGARWLFLPMYSEQAVVGVIGLLQRRLSAGERRLLDALADLVAIGAERIRLAKDVDQAKMLAETEKMRAAMLTSVSHDLRTPLAGILGAITSLRAYDARYSAAQRDELLATAQDETERMSRFVANLLDMTRLDAGALQVKRELCDLQDVVQAAVQRSAKLLARHRLQLELPTLPPFLLADATLLEQVLVNLLDNAAKYAPEQSQISLRVQQHRYALTLEVADHGPGIPPAEQERIFDVFYRIQQADRQRAGTGLGLAICRGFVQAMGGRIRVRNQEEGSGAIFEIEFPASLLRTPSENPA
ncbi:two-component system, OmpR family, sensor histidine kinase KdpD [Solimonas aquatica]|uniref:histidine kinase n=1 Tax=Solimonas aquatica TaxID=489703 RepID=A0A1H9KSR9_9GAMM|nr:sensor histidine kinase KdpD [Solimonas aquatica]SER02089.1 two-component system, OmpR family, sensor histidine kinase KdpD [Solimonas aquatica]